ncbi:IS66 family transposase [Escherichia coli]|uniref:IS66 family transposase n=1 Tax=Escherichia coli TaxID=562 RepID=UPI000BE2EA44
MAATEKTGAPGAQATRCGDVCLKRWPALETYLNNRRVPVDNNRCEQMIRPVARGRKSWLYCVP